MIKVRKFFEYKWRNDRNQAITRMEELNLLTQLPDDIQSEIYAKFLFKSFLNDFKSVFKIPKFKSRQLYTW